MDELFTKALFGTVNFLARLVGMGLRLIFDVTIYLFTLGRVRRLERKESLKLEETHYVTSEVRFSHRLVVGGSGHGKTQALQQFILNDLHQYGRGNGNGNEVKQQADALPAPKAQQFISIIIYCLLLFSFVFPLAVVAAVVVAYASRKKAAGTIYESDRKSQISLAWVNVARVLVIAIAISQGYRGPIIGIILGLALVWTVWRAGIGLYRVLRQRGHSARPKQQAGKPGHKGSIVVIDSQGDMIEKILHLGLMRDYQDRLIYIDPHNLDYPPALNLFDIGLDRINQYSALDRERLINSAIELYEYFFGALLGAELSYKQVAVFPNVARLMLAVPGANIQTLTDFMTDPDKTRPYLSKLDPSTRTFFETEFYKPFYDATRQQITSRLWAIRAKNPTLERMFASDRNKIDLFTAMNNGSLILINTAKDLLREGGTEVLGRFFIALISQAVQERAIIKDERKRTPTFIYIDEAQDYLDERIGILFSQARKYRAGLTIAFQSLSQLDEKLRDIIFANTATKLVGGVTAKDASILAKEMRCDTDHILSVQKTHTDTQFAWYVRDQTQRPQVLHILLGQMEREPRLSAAEYARLLDQNRRRLADIPTEEPTAGFKAPAISVEQPEPI